MHSIRCMIGLLAAAGLACLAVAVPASAANSVFNTSIQKLGADAIASHPGHVLSFNLNQVTLPPEVGVPSRNAVCTPASFDAGKIALNNLGTTPASPEVGASPGSNAYGSLLHASALADSA